MIKNIVFDLGNVILKGHSSDIIDEFDLSNEEKQILKYEFITKNYRKLDLGEITINECINNLNLPFDLKEEYINKLSDYYMYRELNDEVVNLIYKLKKNDYKIYLLSNHCHKVYHYLITDPKFLFLDGVIVSSEYHEIKPSKKIYEILFEKYNLVPNECFFVDDMYENIDTGLKLGMLGHVFNYEECGINKLNEDLIKAGINID